MKIIPTGSIVVTNHGDFLSLRGGDEIDVDDALAERLIRGGNATAVTRPRVQPPVVAAPAVPVETVIAESDASDETDGDAPVEAPDDDDAEDVAPARPAKRGRQGKRLNAAPENK